MRRLAASLLALAALLVAPATVLAHPLGNFTINHYAGIRVGPDAIRLDVVLDRAEIPTFQERLRLDADGDGEVSDGEIASARAAECRAVSASLALTIDGNPASLEVAAAGLSFPPGAGGLSTMRLVCELVAPVSETETARRTVTFADRSFADRIGWREIVVAGDGMTIVGAEDIPDRSLSSRLLAYPKDRLQAPLDVESVTFGITAGGPALPAWDAPDAVPVAGFVATGTRTASVAAAVPGGVAAEIPSIFQSADLSPGVLLAAFATAILLGAGHALTPGHGKTLMAAYLIGTRGTALHAAGLGLSVTVSHTLGIVVLAILVVAAGAALPADVVVRWLPLVAAMTIVAIGGWMLVGDVRRRRRAAAHSGDHGDGDRHTGGDEHGHLHRHPDPHPHPQAQPEAHSHEHAHARPHTQPLPQPHAPGPSLVHEHGGVRHSHAPAPGSTITWRSLFALGLAGGIVPSTSALVILLGTIAAGRPAFGLVLVIFFGLGMALVMGGIGLALVLGRDRLERVTAGRGLGRVAAFMPALAACVVLALGLWLTGQALLVGPIL